MSISTNVPIKQAADYDSQVIAWRMGYSKAATGDNWILGTHFVNLLNAALTPANRIDDLPNFTIQPNSFEQKARLNYDAMVWCFENMPIVEMASSNERSVLYQSYRTG